MTWHTLDNLNTGEIVQETHMDEIRENIEHVGSMMTGVTAISALAAGSELSGLPVGALMPYLGTTAPAGWVLADSRTIGNASSGATQRANADTEALFIHLWNNFGNSLLAIQDSTGSADTRGASAADDFAADKRLPLPDMRGRFGLGADNMGGSSANRVTAAAADTIGSGSGAETHTLIAAELASHSHGLSKVNANADGSGSSFWQNSAGNPSNTASAGGDQAHNNMPPYMTVSYLIRL